MKLLRMLTGLTCIALSLAFMSCGKGAKSGGKVYQGLGITANGRLGPGKDDKGQSVFCINQTVCYAIFDESGKIIDLETDIVEIATPNYDGKEMPDFTGFPLQAFNEDNNHDGKIDGVKTQTEQSYLAEVAAWKTKRDRGATYVLKSGTWEQQMDRFEAYFIGKTVDEIADVFAKKADKNGRMDVVSGATMSLKDAHGDMLGALQKAYANKVEIAAGKPAKLGLGVIANGRVGPGKDSTGQNSYSFNTQFAGATYDSDGKLLGVRSDIMEVASINGHSSPVLTGFPGQSYKTDSDGDGKIDGEKTQTPENFIEEVSKWITKREKGPSYRLQSGSWSEEMDRFEAHFVGMTEADLLKFESSLDAKGKTDAVSGATMSVKDAHGNTIGAILQTWAKAKEIGKK